MPPLSYPPKSKLKYRFKPASYKIIHHQALRLHAFSLRGKKHGVIKPKKNKPPVFGIFMPKINNASPGTARLPRLPRRLQAINQADGSTKRHIFPLPYWQKRRSGKREVKRIYVVPLALMLIMLSASAWLEPAPRHAARGLCVWFDGAMVDCLQRQRLGEGRPAHALVRR